MPFISSSAFSSNWPSIIDGDLSVEIQPGQTFFGSINALDANGLTDGDYFSISKSPLHGSAVINPQSGQWIYIADPNFFGIETFNVVVTDDLNFSQEITISISIISKNDMDRDGVEDTADAFPNDPAESYDSDNDGIGDNSDPFPMDFDNDGIKDDLDAFPYDASESSDSDNDGVGDNADQFPNNENEFIDTDSDGIGNNADTDDDNDGVDDHSDNCSLVVNSREYVADYEEETYCYVDEWCDYDPGSEEEFCYSSEWCDYYLNEIWAYEDGPDTDGDSFGDACDDFPSDSNENLDSDGDGVGDNADLFPLDASEIYDNDGDGVGNNLDVFPDDPTETMDSDGDGVGNNIDAFPFNKDEVLDSDGDGIGENADVFPNDASEFKDSDDDGLGDNADPYPENIDGDNDGVIDLLDHFPTDPLESSDMDGDTIGDNQDNCPMNKNKSQADVDGDGAGDACDAFPISALEILDTDGDGIGNNADPDNDNDGVHDAIDVFPNDSLEFLDTDGDGIGDNTDLDDDNDGMYDSFDNCPKISNYVVEEYCFDWCDDYEGQENCWSDCYSDTFGGDDSDYDGFGNVCDSFPNDRDEWQDSDGDGVGDNKDVFPNNPDESIDSDGDGVGDNADLFPLDAKEILDNDGDGLGNQSDPFPNNLDGDSDGVQDNLDAFPRDPSESLDSDGDGIGDNSDAFPLDGNEWIDHDSDGVGDNADMFPDDTEESIDSDLDGIGDSSDNCIYVENHDQLDSDGDQVGDRCDTDSIDYDSKNGGVFRAEIDLKLLNVICDSPLVVEPSYLEVGYHCFNGGDYGIYSAVFYIVVSDTTVRLLEVSSLSPEDWNHFIYDPSGNINDINITAKNELHLYGNLDKDRRVISVNSSDNMLVGTPFFSASNQIEWQMNFFVGLDGEINGTFSEENNITWSIDDSKYSAKFSGILSGRLEDVFSGEPDIFSEQTKFKVQKGHLYHEPNSCKKDPTIYNRYTYYDLGERFECSSKDDYTSNLYLFISMDSNHIFGLEVEGFDDLEMQGEIRIPRGNMDYEMPRYEDSSEYTLCEEPNIKCLQSSVLDFSSFPVLKLENSDSRIESWGIDDRTSSVEWSWRSSTSLEPLIPEDDLAVQWLSDEDGDGVKNFIDNCIEYFNPTQSDIDNDTLGDECDTDIDGDGWTNKYENHFGFDQFISGDVSSEHLQELAILRDLETQELLNRDDTIFNDANLDTDNDGLSDALEYVLGGNPKDPQDKGLIDQIKDYVINTIGKSVPAMGSFGILGLGLSMMGLGLWTNRKQK